MLTLENRTEAVLEAVGGRGEILAIAHDPVSSGCKSVVLVHLPERVLAVWGVNIQPSPPATYYGHYLPYGPGYPDWEITLSKAWARFAEYAVNLGWEIH